MEATTLEATAWSALVAMLGTLALVIGGGKKIAYLLTVLLYFVGSGGLHSYSSIYWEFQVQINTRSDTLLITVPGMKAVARSVYGNYSVALPNVTYKGIKHKHDFCNYENAQIGKLKKLHSDKISESAPVVPTIQFKEPVVPNIQFKEPVVPNIQFKEPVVPNIQFKEPLGPTIQFQEPLVPTIQFQEPVVPTILFQVPATQFQKFDTTFKHLIVVTICQIIFPKIKRLHGNEGAWNNLDLSTTNPPSRDV